MVYNNIKKYLSTLQEAFAEWYKIIRVVYKIRKQKSET